MTRNAKPGAVVTRPCADGELTKVLAITRNVSPPIYAPSDDSLLMIEALTKMHLSRKRILDMGTGSGILGLYCAMNGADVTASDIDEAAIQETERAAKRLGVELRLYVSDLFLTLQGRFELIIFNPPYLPSQIREDRAVDGGPSGTMLIDTFLNALPEHLEKNGASLLLLSSLNDPNSVQQRHTNLNFTTIARRSLFFEEILVLRVSFRNDLTI